MQKNRSLTINAIYKIILNICNIIIPIIVGPYILRILDRSVYDLFNSLEADFAIVLVIGAFGVYTYGVREISRIRDDKEKVNKAFSEILIISVISNISVFIFYLIYVFVFIGNQIQIVICVILAMQLIGNIFNVEWVNEANENYGFIALKSIIVRIIYVICIFIFVRRSEDIVPYSIIVVSSSLANTIISFVYISKRNKIKVKGLEFKKHLLPLFIIFCVSNISILYAQLDKVMLKYFVDYASVSCYQISQYISSLIYNLLIPVVVVAIPRLSNLFLVDKKSCYETHFTSLNSFLLFAIPALIGCCILSNEIIQLYGGENYLDCIIPLSIYSIAQLISGFSYSFGEALLYIGGREKKLLLNNLVGGFVNVVLNIIFIVFGCFSSIFAVISVLVAYLVVFLLNYICARKLLDYKFSIFNKHTLCYMVLSLAFIPIVIICKTFINNIIVRSIISIAACMVLYFVVLLVIKDSLFIIFVDKVKSKIKTIFRR